MYIFFAQNVNRACANNNYYRLLIAVDVYEFINNLATLERDSSEFLQKYNDSIRICLFFFFLNYRERISLCVEDQHFAMTLL